MADKLLRRLANVAIALALIVGLFTVGQTGLVTVANAESPTVKYAVSIYGISVDILKDGIAGLTFGPALGGDYRNSFHSHTPSGTTISGNTHRCVHNDDWLTIIEWNHNDPYVYEQCIAEGCTHSVELKQNGTTSILNDRYTQECTGDGPNVLYTELMTYDANNVGPYKMNLEYAPVYAPNGSGGYTYGGWGASHVRAMLNGADSLTNTSTYWHSVTGVEARNSSYYPEFSASMYTSQNNLFMTFPEELRGAIGARQVKYDPIINNFSASNNKSTYDKLWLVSPNEVSTTVNNDRYNHPLEGTVYEKFNGKLLAGYSNNASENTYTVVSSDGKTTDIHTRSIYLYTYEYLAAIDGSTGDFVGSANYPYGIGACFTLDRKYDPTSNVKRSSDDESRWEKISDDTWIYRFKVIDASNYRYFWENNYAGYQTDHTKANPGAIINKSGTVYNESQKVAPVSYGRVIVSKTVSDESTIPFVFHITITDEDGNSVMGVKTYSDTLFQNGKATFTLRNGESKEFILPDGYHYSITEDESAGYTSSVSSGNDSGVIDQTEDKTVTFLNQADELETESVTLKKKVTGNVINPDDEYEFYVSFEGLKALTTYAASDGTIFTADKSGSATTTITLKNGESVKFEKLPVGSKYQFLEKGGDFSATYEITDANGLNSFIQQKGTNATENKDLATAVEIVDQGEDITVEFTNEFNVTTDLLITKQVLNPPASGDDTQFEFTLNLSGMTPGMSVNSDIGRITADEDGNAEKVFYMNDGKAIVIQDLPVGVSYEVTESANAYKASYSITDGDTDDGVASSAGVALGTGMKELKQGDSTTVAFTNDVERSKLTITKTVVYGESDDLNTLFELNIRLRNDGKSEESHGQPISGEFPYEITHSDGTPSSGTLIFDRVGLSTVEMKHGDVVTINQLRVGSFYVVDEPNESDDFHGTSAEGYVLRDGTSKAEIINSVLRKASVTVSKTVTGNLGNREKDFTFTVHIEDPYERSVNGLYLYHGTQGGISVTDGELHVDGNGDGTIELRHGDSITFDVYVGAEVTITEDDYSSEGYSVTYRNNGITVSKTESQNKIAATNKNGTTIPTGILPATGGAMLLVIGIAGLFALTMAQKREKRMRT